MKYNESIPFDPMWCSIIAADLTHTGGPRKRFVEEYESNLCYRRCAKDLIADGNFYGVTVLPCAKRTEGLKIASVLYYLLYADKTPKYTKLVMLFGKEYGSVASLVSEIYKNEKDGMLKLAKRMSGLYGSEIGNVAVFAIFLLASPESYLEQNRMAFSRLCNTLSQMTRKTDAEKPLSEQEKFFAQYGMANQKNFSDLVTNAVLVSGTNDLMLEDENGDIGHFDWFSFSNYGVSCSAEMLSTLALLDAGVANSPAYDRTITKQKFTEAQRSVAKSLYFTKVGEDGKVVRGDFFSLMDDEHIKIDDNGRILADETSSLAVAAIVNLYNTMLPILNDQVQEGLDGVNFLCKQRTSRLVVIQFFSIRIVRHADVHDVDAIDRRRVHTDELAVNRLTSAAIVFQALQRRDDEYLRIHLRQTQCKELCGKGLAITGRAENNSVCVSMNIRIEHIDSDKGVVGTVCTNHNAVRVLHFKGNERIARCYTRGQYVALCPALDVLMELTKRKQCRLKALFHHKVRTANLHALAFNALFKGIVFVFQLIQTITNNGDKNTQEVHVRWYQCR